MSDYTPCLYNIPTEIWVTITKNSSFEPSDLCHIAKTCRKFRDVVRLLWKNLPCQKLLVPMYLRRKTMHIEGHTRIVDEKFGVITALDENRRFTIYPLQTSYHYDKIRDISFSDDFSDMVRSFDFVEFFLKRDSTSTQNLNAFKFWFLHFDLEKKLKIFDKIKDDNWHDLADESARLIIDIHGMEAVSILYKNQAPFIPGDHVFILLTRGCYDIIDLPNIDASSIIGMLSFICCSNDRHAIECFEKHAYTRFFWIQRDVSMQCYHGLFSLAIRNGSSDALDFLWEWTESRRKECYRKIDEISQFLSGVVQSLHADVHVFSMGYLFRKLVRYAVDFSGGICYDVFLRGIQVVDDGFVYLLKQFYDMKLIRGVQPILYHVHAKSIKIQLIEMLFEHGITTLTEPCPCLEGLFPKEFYEKHGIMKFYEGGQVESGDSSDSDDDRPF
jgi:hypothetical protein